MGMFVIQVREAGMVAKLAASPTTVDVVVNQQRDEVISFTKKLHRVEMELALAEKQGDIPLQQHLGVMKEALLLQRQHREDLRSVLQKSEMLQVSKQGDEGGGAKLPSGLDQLLESLGNDEEDEAH